jgi:hypothetical protein
MSVRRPVRDSAYALALTRGAATGAVPTKAPYGGPQPASQAIEQAETHRLQADASALPPLAERVTWPDLTVDEQKSTNKSSTGTGGDAEQETGALTVSSADVRRRIRKVPRDLAAAVQRIHKRYRKIGYRGRHRSNMTSRSN